MKKSRIKITLPTIADRPDAENVMSFIAALENSKRKLIADRDAAILKINENIAAPLAELDECIQQNSEALRRWAESNSAEFPKGRKSMELANGILGFRTGTPKLVLLNRSWNWVKVLEAVQSFLPAFIRNKPEIDRESIIAQVDEVAYILPRCGVKVIQDESFFVEPRLTDMDARKVVDAKAP